MIDPVRIAAVAVGGLLAAAPSIGAAAKALLERNAAPAPPVPPGPPAPPVPPGPPDATADAHLILDVAGRLRAAGNAKGVDLCHQLIDAILQEPVK